MRNKELRRKLVISGPLVERLEFYYTPIRRGVNIERHKPSVPDPEKIMSSVSRARSKIRRLIFANFCLWKDKNGYIIPSKFLTLTFEENIQDLKSANYHLTKFIQKLNYTFRNSLSNPLKYVCVPEFQTRGAVHYHLVLFNFPFIDSVFKRIRNLWTEGRFVLKTINKNQNALNVANYISKYITKQAIDGRFWGQKRFFTSREIKQSIILKDDVAIELTCWTLSYFEKYKTTLNVPYCGDISYWLYYLGEGRTIYSLPLLDPYAKEQIMLAEENKKP